MSARVQVPFALLALAAVGAGCPPVVQGACTEVGCGGELTVSVEDEAGVPLDGVAGTITVDDQVFVVDCDGTSDPEVTCAAGAVTVMLPMDVGGSDVHVDLAAGGGPPETGMVEPQWTSETPNGPTCAPTCFTGAVTLVVLPS